MKTQVCTQHYEVGKTCPNCRDLNVPDCPGCDPVRPLNDNISEPLVLYDEIESIMHAEMFRDVGEYDYYPGCYEG